MLASRSSFSNWRPKLPRRSGIILQSLLILCGEWGCRERTVQVLEAGGKAPAGSNAPPAAAGAPNGNPNAPSGGTGNAGTSALDGGAGRPASLAACALGRELGADCTSSRDCCSGFCGPTPTGQLRCLPTAGCLKFGDTCGAASDCCSLACVSSALGSTCDDFGYCAPKGGVCSASSDCCTSFCNGGICESPAPPPCLQAGEPCKAATDCCGSICALAGDGRTRCQLLPACRVVGEFCRTPSDCCSGDCPATPNAVSRCAASKVCTVGDGKSCARQVGDLCKTADECCSRICSKQTDGSLRCSSAPACRGACETCNRDPDCCSSVCTPDAEGTGHCSAAVPLAEGEVCARNEDCVQSPLVLHCVEEPAGQRIKRCRHDLPAADCLAEGTACALGSNCCGGICVQDGAWVFRCVSGFLAEGERCSSGTDCYSANADCVAIFGERLCRVIAAP